MKRSNRYKIPNKKKWLLTDAFLQTFKEELDDACKVRSQQENPTYWNTYAWLTGTVGFYSALEQASKKHNVTKAIYEYASKLPWDKSDTFDYELTDMMCEKNIIEEGTLDEDDGYPTEEELAEWAEKGEIRWTEEVFKHKDYTVIRKDWEFVENEWERKGDEPWTT